MSITNESSGLIGAKFGRAHPNAQATSQVGSASWRAAFPCEGRFFQNRSQSFTWA